MGFVEQQAISFLRIADFVIALENQSALPVLVDDGLQPFLIDDADAADFTVEIHRSLHDARIQGNRVYRAVQQHDVLWEIYESPQHRTLIIYNPHDLSRVQQVVELSALERRCKVFATWDETREFTPLDYPLIPLILYHLTTQNDALMVHASAVNFRDKGFIFSGFSGVGKSTLAKLFYDRGALVVNDDRVMIRKQNGRTMVYNTPMYYTDQPKVSPVHGILFPFHAPENSHQRMSGAAALGQLMAFVIHHAYDKDHLTHHMDVAADIVQSLPLTKLGVVPDPAIIDYIWKIHEAENTH